MEKRDYITPIIYFLLIVGAIGACIAIFSDNSSSSSGAANQGANSTVTDDSGASSDGTSHTHIVKAVPELLPTCTESGHAAYEYCLKCNYTTEGDPIAALGHDITSENTATCTEGGYISESCTRCDYTYTAESDPIDCTYNEEGICTMCNIPEGSVILNGTFEFKESLTIPGAIILTDTAFTYNGVEYDHFQYERSSLIFGIDGNFIEVYTLDGWADKATITFDNVIVPSIFYEGFQYLIEQ